MRGAFGVASDTGSAPAEPALPKASGSDRRRIVLHVGCGPANPRKLHPWFRTQEWREVRLDIDPAMKPDIVADLSRLAFLRSGSVGAIWSSHNLEHLHEHECRRALREFARVLAPDGFALMTMPDLTQIARAIVEGGLEQVLYESPAGPIQPLDTLFGLRSAVERGNTFMAHKTGFSVDRLGTMLIETGFAEAHVWQGSKLDLWGVGLMRDAVMVGEEPPVSRGAG